MDPFNKRLFDGNNTMHCRNGCKDRFLITDRNQHNDVCRLRVFRCPICLLWRSSAKYFHLHFADCNCLRRDSEYFPIVLNGRRIEIIKHEGEFYVMIYSYCDKTKCLMISLKYVGALNYAKRKYFKLYLERLNNEQYQFGNQVEAAYNWKLNDKLAMKIPIETFSRNERVKIKIELYSRVAVFQKTIKDQLYAKMLCPECKQFMNGTIVQTHPGRSICQNCHLKTEGSIGIRNFTLENFNKQLCEIKNADDESNVGQLLKEVECVICADYMYPPVKTCVSGHSICCYCRSKLTECPMCKNEFSIYRNTTLELATGIIHHKCMNAEHGCKFTGLHDDIIEHENNCAHNPASKMNEI